MINFKYDRLCQMEVWNISIFLLFLFFLFKAKFSETVVIEIYLCMYVPPDFGNTFRPSRKRERYLSVTLWSPRGIFVEYFW